MRTRVDGIVDSTGDPDPAYVEGMHAAVSIAIDYGLTAIERGEPRVPPVPVALLAQARIAARSGISLDTVLRRYFAGYTLLGDFLIQEVESGAGLQGATLQSMMRAPAAVFDRVVTAVTEEYTRELDELSSSGKGQRVKRIRRLLAGEFLDPSEFGYEFDAWHLGALVTGRGAVETMRGLAKALDRRLLFIPDGEGAIWAWLGGRQRLSVEDVLAVAEDRRGDGLTMVLGEPGRGLAGWRLTHRQAMAALPIARRTSERLVCYADVALVASMVQDDLLATSLHELYLAPLSEERDGGTMLLETLRAFFAAEKNVSSAAMALGVKRHTVTNRLRVIEKRLGRPLSACGTEMDAALRLEEIGHPSSESEAFLHD